MKRRCWNLMEMLTGIVHADGANGNDYTLCGLTAENTLESPADYTPELAEREGEAEPYLAKTARKIDCGACAAIIRHCCKLGRRSIGETKEGGAE